MREGQKQPPLLCFETQKGPCQIGLSKRWGSLGLAIPLLTLFTYFRRYSSKRHLSFEAFTLPCCRNSNRCRGEFRTLSNVHADFFCEIYIYIYIYIYICIYILDF